MEKCNNALATKELQWTLNFLVKFGYNPLTPFGKGDLADLAKNVYVASSLSGEVSWTPNFGEVNYPEILDNPATYSVYPKGWLPYCVRFAQ